MTAQKTGHPVRFPAGFHFDDYQELTPILPSSLRECETTSGKCVHGTKPTPCFPVRSNCLLVLLGAHEYAESC